MFAILVLFLRTVRTSVHVVDGEDGCRGTVVKEAVYMECETETGKLF